MSLVGVEGLRHLPTEAQGLAVLRMEAAVFGGTDPAVGQTEVQEAIEGAPRRAQQPLQTYRERSERRAGAPLRADARQRVREQLPSLVSVGDRAVGVDKRNALMAFQYVFLNGAEDLELSRGIEAAEGLG